MIVRQRVESDSEDSQQQNEIRIQMPRKVDNDQQKLAKKMLLVLCIIILTVLTVLYIIISRINSSQQLKTAQITSQKLNKIQHTNSQNQIATQIKPQPSINIPSPIVNPIKKTFEPNTTLTLPSFNQTKSFGESELLWKDLKSGKMYWYNDRQISCEPDMLVNSASKITDNLYIQKTVYQTITVIDRKVDIPAQNIYRYEPPRQFIQKLVKNNENTIAYCHNSPQLLLLATVSSKKGLFVCNSSQWQLFKHNLVINDLFPKVKPYSIQQILSSNSYNILITYDFSLIKTVLYEQKRQMVILMEITEPTSIETYILLKLKVYRFEQGNQCDTRKIEIYQQSAWHIDNTATIMPGWYAFTTDFYSLPITYESKNYENPLLSYRKLACIKKSDFKPISQIINKNYIIANVPFEEFHLLKSTKDPPIDEQDYRPIVRYYQENPVNSIYLHSGSYFLIVLLISTLQKGAKIVVNSNYNNIHLLKKNLVLNDLQMELLNDQQFNKTNVELIVAQQKISKELLIFNPKMILFKGQQEIRSIDFPNYQVYSFSQKEQCGKTTLQKPLKMLLEKKTYILLKSS